METVKITVFRNEKGQLAYRKHECWPCKHEWQSIVRSGSTFNLSGELSTYCPKCYKKSSAASPTFFV